MPRVYTLDNPTVASINVLHHAIPHISAQIKPDCQDRCLVSIPLLLSTNLQCKHKPIAPCNNSYVCSKFNTIAKIEKLNS